MPRRRRALPGGCHDCQLSLTSGSVWVRLADCGVEICLTLFAFQQLYPRSVMLNRGNHEERSVHSMYGFYQVR